MRDTGVFLWLFFLTLCVAGLVYAQHTAEQRFKEHWHYSPKVMTIKVDEPHLSSNPPYHLTKTPPKKEAVAECWNYVFYYRWR